MFTPYIVLNQGLDCLSTRGRLAGFTLTLGAGNFLRGFEKENRRGRAAPAVSCPGTRLAGGLKPQPWRALNFFWVLLIT